ncbi:YezD family protein [Blautia liquoris]|uniref:YezD family protein n=1 Tax=Blautia liquoris TaxID=2779518 RepID=A0A7M2RI21_9FIRM|nr:YezD family protein [Blautia liquoris]QOV19012.1 YezD family protein [Blautia liquoris]
MAEDRVSAEELKQIRQLIESIRYGSVTVVVQDGRVIQIEKNEKIRFR